MPFGPGILVSGFCLAGYGYWRFSFRQVTSAMRMEKAGNIDEARRLMRGFVENKNPLSNRGEAKQRCRLLLARLERRAGDYARAVYEADALLTHPSSAGIAAAALEVKGDALAWAGDLDGAVRSLQQSLDRLNAPRMGALRLGSFASEVKGMLARVLLWQGELDRADEILQEMISLPGAAGWYAHLRMSDAARVQGDFEAAIEWARRLTEHLASAAIRDPRHTTWAALARLYGGRAAYLSGDLDQAVEWLTPIEAASALPPPESIAWWGLQSVVAEAGGREAEAREYVNRLHTLSRTTPAGFGAHAWQSYYEGKRALLRRAPREAAEQTAAATRLGPPGDSVGELFYQLGLALQQAGDPGATGAFQCGARQPDRFLFSRLCREKLSVDPTASPTLARLG